MNPPMPKETICRVCGERTEDSELCPYHIDLATRCGNTTIEGYVERDQVYYCQNIECAEQEVPFIHKGLPTVCPCCGGPDITSGIELVDRYIKEKQAEEAYAGVV